MKPITPKSKISDLFGTHMLITLALRKFPQHTVKHHGCYGNKALHCGWIFLTSFRTYWIWQSDRIQLFYLGKKKFSFIELIIEWKRVQVVQLHPKKRYWNYKRLHLKMNRETYFHSKLICCTVCSIRPMHLKKIIRTRRVIDQLFKVKYH